MNKNTTVKPISYEMFNKTIKEIQKYNKNTQKLSDAFEKYLMENSWCIISIGDNLADQSLKLLAEFFKQYTELNVYEVITWWLYEDVEKVIYQKNGEATDKIDVSTTKKLYDFLCSYKDKILAPKVT